jgi:hypothetical protein
VCTYKIFSGEIKMRVHLITLLLTTIIGGATWATGQNLSLGPTTAGSVPQQISFSGTLKDSTGRTLTAITGVTFLLYKDEQGGVPLWLETQSVAPDKTGHYTVQLGATSAHGIPPDTFRSGEARWLGVQLAAEHEQPRVLLVAVPYAMKAADAQTLGGLPASAFVLAAPGGASSASSTAGESALSSSGSALPPATSSVTTTGGTVNALPLFTTATNVQSSAITQTGTGTTAKIGINTASPAATLDVRGSATVRGLLNLPATAAATATAGKNSQGQNLVASSFSSTTSTAVNQVFRWQAEPAGNNTANPSGTLNLLYGLGAAAPAETGLKISKSGIFTFAPGQTFPGTGSSIGLSAPVTDFTVTGSPVNGSGTLSLAWITAPTSTNTAGAIVKRDVNGNFAAGSIVGTTSNPGGYGVGGFNTSTGYGVYGSGPTFAGVWGDTAIGNGVVGNSSGSGVGVAGQSTSGYGVSGTSNTSDGVRGEAFGPSGFGVNGRNVTAGGTGVTGTGGNYGVSGVSLGSNGTGVYGSGSYAGVYGDSTGYGVYGSGSTYGVYGTTSSANGSAVGAISTSTGDALYVYNESGGYAGLFFGDVFVNGTLSKSGGSFQIDHPNDPANKFLFHSFVESPDMMNIYNGNVTTDAHGDAVVTMPDWFEALNRDFRYQLTVMGQFAQAIVAQKMNGNRFSIKTDKPNVEVSWQVTGVRHDAWANEHRIPVEQAKPEGQRGFYLHPELFGAPAAKSIALARHPETTRLLEGKNAPKP